MIRGVAIWEIIWTGGWPHLSGLTPIWGPHLHAKRPEEGIVFRPKDSLNSMGPVARRNFTLDVTGQPCCLVHSSSWVRPHTGRKLHGLLNQMQNISLRSSGMRRMQNFEFLGLQVTQQSWLLLFTLSLPPLFSLFLPHFSLLLGIW